MACAAESMDSGNGDSSDESLPCSDSSSPRVTFKKPQLAFPIPSYHRPQTPPESVSMSISPPPEVLTVDEIAKALRRCGDLHALQTAQWLAENMINTWEDMVNVPWDELSPLPAHITPVVRNKVVRAGQQGVCLHTVWVCEVWYTWVWVGAGECGRVWVST